MTLSGPRHRLRQGALLLAALLHLLGTAAGPVLHGWLRPDPHAAGWSAERAGLVAAHDELACGLCQAGTSNALLSAPPLPVPFCAPALPEAAPAAPPLRSPDGSSLCARAPPAAHL
jgi:hypothetical protein